MGSARHVAKVDWQEWLAHLPDPIQSTQPLDWEPLALGQGYQQAEQGQAVARSWHVAHVPALPFVAQQRCSSGGSQSEHVVDDADGARRRIRFSDRGPGGNWIQQWSATHGKHYFWNGRDPQLVVWEIPDYKVVHHEV